MAMMVQQAPHGVSESLLGASGQWISRPKEGCANSESIAPVYMPMQCTKVAKSAILEKYQSLARDCESIATT